MFGDNYLKTMIGMNNQQIKSVITLILSRLGVNAKKVSLYSEYSNDFGFNDSEFNLFLYYIEKYFGIAILPSEESQLRTVSNTVDYVKTHLVS